MSILIALLLTTGCLPVQAPRMAREVAPPPSCWAAPDGRQFAFLVLAEPAKHQGHSRGDIELWWVDAVTGRARRLSQNIVVRVCWSPDSKSIAYGRLVRGDGQGRCELRVAQPATGSDSLLLHDTVLLGDLSWSPSGKWIALARASNDREVRADLLLVNVAGHGSIRASWALARGSMALGPAWSRPEDTLFFPAWYGQGRNHIAQVRTDAQGIIDQDTIGTNHEVDRVYPDPTGKYLAYTFPASLEFRSLEAVALVDLGSREETVLAETPGLWQVAWSPDGSAIALASSDGDLTSVDLRTGRRKRVSSGVGLLVGGSPWTPADTILFFPRGPEPALWSVATDGSKRHVVVDLLAGVNSIRR
jgi:Tol biopolymer transport system component